MRYIRKILPYIILFALLAVPILGVIQINELKKDVRSITQGVDEVQDEREALWEAIETLQKEYSQIAIEPPAGPAFKPDPNIPLSSELQEYTISICQKKDIDPAILFALMYRESRFQEDATGYNRNGTRDHGLCQLNDVTLSFLADHGIDPTESPQENIRAAVELITYYRDERGYTLLESLAAYGVGEGGMLSGRGFGAAEKLIERAELFCVA